MCFPVISVAQRLRLASWSPSLLTHAKIEMENQYDNIHDRND